MCKILIRLGAFHQTKTTYETWWMVAEQIAISTQLVLPIKAH